MRMVITDKFLTKGASHGRTGQAMVPKGIVVHYVGNAGSSADSNRNWFEGGAGGAWTSAHYIVGLQGEVLRLIPDNECAQHAGKSYGPQWNAQAPKNNGMYIGIECCHVTADGKFGDKVYKSLIELCAELCKKYGFSSDKDVFRHYDVCGKQCPLWHAQHQSDWDGLKKDIAKAMTGTAPAPKDTVLVKFTGQTFDVSAKLDNDIFYVKLSEIARFFPDIRCKMRLIFESAGLQTDFDPAKNTYTVK